MSDITLHLYASDFPQHELTHFYADLVPRVGDRVHYWVDRSATYVNGPGTIDGTVARVEIEYRRMHTRTVSLVSVYLDDCKTKPQTKVDED